MGDLEVVRHPVAVRVRGGGVRSVHVHFVPVGQPVAVGIRVRRVRTGGVLVEIAQGVRVGVARSALVQVRPIGQFPAVGETVSVAVGAGVVVGDREHRRRRAPQRRSPRRALEAHEHRLIGLLHRVIEHRHRDGPRGRIAGPPAERPRGADVVGSRGGRPVPGGVRHRHGAGGPARAGDRERCAAGILRYGDSRGAELKRPGGARRRREIGHVELRDEGARGIRLPGVHHREVGGTDLACQDDEALVGREGDVPALLEIGSSQVRAIEKVPPVRAEDHEDDVLLVSVRGVLGLERGRGDRAIRGTEAARAVDVPERIHGGPEHRLRVAARAQASAVERREPEGPVAVDLDGEPVPRLKRALEGAGAGREVGRFRAADDVEVSGRVDDAFRLDLLVIVAAEPREVEELRRVRGELGEIEIHPASAGGLDGAQGRCQVRPLRVSAHPDVPGRVHAQRPAHLRLAAARVVRRTEERAEDEPAAVGGDLGDPSIDAAAPAGLHDSGRRGEVRGIGPVPYQHFVRGKEVDRPAVLVAVSSDVGAVDELIPVRREPDDEGVDRAVDASVRGPAVEGRIERARSRGKAGPGAAGAEDLARRVHGRHVGVVLSGPADVGRIDERPVRVELGDGHVRPERSIGTGPGGRGRIVRPRRHGPRRVRGAAGDVDVPVRIDGDRAGRSPAIAPVRGERNGGIDDERAGRVVRLEKLDPVGRLAPAIKTAGDRGPFVPRLLVAEELAVPEPSDRRHGLHHAGTVRLEPLDAGVGKLEGSGISAGLHEELVGQPPPLVEEVREIDLRVNVPVKDPPVVPDPGDPPPGVLTPEVVALSGKEFEGLGSDRPVAHVDIDHHSARVLEPLAPAALPAEGVEDHPPGGEPHLALRAPREEPDIRPLKLPPVLLEIRLRGDGALPERDSPRARRLLSFSA